MKNIRQTIRDITPSVYACLALALHRKHGWGYKRINVQSCVNFKEGKSKDGRC